MTEITYWQYSGGGANGRWRRPRFRSAAVPPDGRQTTELRHYWTRDGRRLDVIGTDPIAVEEEYLRLWKERRGIR